MLSVPFGFSTIYKAVFELCSKQIHWKYNNSHVIVSYSVNIHHFIKNKIAYEKWTVNITGLYCFGEYEELDVKMYGNSQSPW